LRENIKRQQSHGKNVEPSDSYLVCRDARLASAEGMHGSKQLLKDLGLLLDQDGVLTG
jgi:hypothetical protein